MTETVLTQLNEIQPRDNINIDFEHAIALAERLDFLDVQLLRKFYMSGKEQPFDLQPYCFPMLYGEMKITHKIKIGREALRKRLDNLVLNGLLEKVKRSSPANYSPYTEKVSFIRAIITKFFVINGLTKFL
ncbi:MAG: hypothetical protein HYW23_03575 [Candidatus Aenigmarchaeota archaeon]|nr:hypothetical protein [Candidatus Aenigmarchaeota archaeon]